MRKIVLLASLALLPGCFLAPAMKMDESAAVSRGRDATRDPDFRIHPVTPELLTRLALETAPPPKATDPLAAEAVTYEYRIAPYDVLTVTVWDHPELTTPTGQFRSPEENGNPVNADGTMYYPYVGIVPVAGKTVAEVRRMLTDRLTRVITNPQLDVRVASFRGSRAHVTGEVRTPTAVPITDVPLRVQDAIAAAQGFTPEADWSNVTLSRDGRTFRLNLQALYEHGDLTQNWLVKGGDVINVADRTLNKVFVLGEVQQPQSKLMNKGRLTLAEVLNESGRLEPSIANVSQIFVIRGDYEAPSIYRLNASSPDALLLAAQFQLRPRDVVFISTYRLAQWNRVISQILPTVTALWTTYDLASRITETVQTGELIVD